MNQAEALAKLKQWLVDWEKATPGEWTARPKTAAFISEKPDTVERISRDGQGRKVTQYVAVCSGGQIDNATNAAFIALSRTALPALVRLGIMELERHSTKGRCMWCTHLPDDPCPVVAAWIATIEEISK